MNTYAAFFNAVSWHKTMGFVPPELEEIIATAAIYSYYYASHVLKERFELGEVAITTDSYYSYCYAYDVLNDRFELGEPVILNSEYKDPYLTFLSDKGNEL